MKKMFAAKSTLPSTCMRVLAVSIALAVTQPAAAQQSAVASSDATVVITGLGGSSAFDEQFTRYSEAIAEHARQLANNEDDVILLSGENANKQSILDTLSRLGKRNAEDSVRVFLIGHGSFDGSEYKYNIPGPDITGTELVNALNELPSTKQLVVVATSASGALLEPLQADHRVTITATKNGRERNAVKFTEHLVAGLTDPATDLDKDESISSQELYNYTERAVASYYETEKLLASEHSRITGDLADSIELARYGLLLANQEVISEELIAERQAISGLITSLRNRKDEMGEDAYFDELQSLMLELANVQSAIDDSQQATEQTPASTNTGATSTSTNTSNSTAAPVTATTAPNTDSTDKGTPSVD